MSHSAISIATGCPFATVFFGGAGRGKIIQFHMDPEDLPVLATLGVQDSDTELESTLAEWIVSNNADLDMALFDRYANPKVASVSIEIC